MEHVRRSRSTKQEQGGGGKNVSSDVITCESSSPYLSLSWGFLSCHSWYDSLTMNRTGLDWTGCTRS